MAIAGKVAITNEGEYSELNGYDKMCLVSYNNGIYISRKSVPIGTLPTDEEYWFKVLSVDSENTLRPDGKSVEQSLVDLESGATISIGSVGNPGILAPDGVSIVADEFGNISALFDDTTHVKISQADYDLLSDEEKHNGSIYFIYDAPISGVVTIDDALSDISENPLQNKVVTSAVNGISDRVTSIENGDVHLADNTQGKKYSLGVENGLIYIQEV